VEQDTYTLSRLATANHVYDPLNQSERVKIPFSDPEEVDPYVLINSPLEKKLIWNY
jgi:hypothetical protein